VGAGAGDGAVVTDGPAIALWPRSWNQAASISRNIGSSVVSSAATVGGRTGWVGGLTSPAHRFRTGATGATGAGLGRLGKGAAGGGHAGGSAIVVVPAVAAAVTTVAPL
jgi:hypothetical protein